MKTKKKMELEDLALMVKHGFDGVDKRFDGVEGRLDKVENRLDRVENRLDDVDKRLDHVDARLGNIERDVSYLRQHFVFREEFEDLMARVKYLERKQGVNSGK